MFYFEMGKVVVIFYGIYVFDIIVGSGKRKWLYGICVCGIDYFIECGKLKIFIIDGFYVIDYFYLFYFKVFFLSMQKNLVRNSVINMIIVIRFLFFNVWKFIVYG